MAGALQGHALIHQHCWLSRATFQGRSCGGLHDGSCRDFGLCAARGHTESIWYNHLLHCVVNPEGFGVKPTLANSQGIYFWVHTEVHKSRPRFSIPIRCGR